MQINQYKDISEAEMLGEFTVWNRSPSQAVRVSVRWQAADARLLLGVPFWRLLAQAAPARN